MTEPDPLAAIRQAMTDIEFGRIVRAEARRTVLCSPADVDRIRWHVDQEGLADVLTVLESPVVPDGQAYVFDEQALEAAQRESFSRHPRIW